MKPIVLNYNYLKDVFFSKFIRNYNKQFFSSKNGGIGAEVARGCFYLDKRLHTLYDMNRANITRGDQRSTLFVFKAYNYIIHILATN